MQVCSARTTTNTPRGSGTRFSVSATPAVSCSWVCNRRAWASTTRPILLSPARRSPGRYPTCARPENGNRWCAQIDANEISWTNTAPPRTIKLSLAHKSATLSPQFAFPALSRDGTRIAYVGFDDQHRTVIYVRDLADLEAVPLPGTEGGTLPFWSPDGSYLGFFQDNKLKKVNVSGGPPQVLCSAEGIHDGATWSEGGDILFGSTYGSDKPILRTSAGGGDAIAVTEMDSTDEGHIWPSFLPDGKHFVYLGDASSAENHYLKVASLDGALDKRLANEISNFQFVPPDLVLFGKSGVLVAQRMDLDLLELVGEPIALARDVVVLDGHNYQFTASHTGILAFRSASPLSQLTWFDRSGRRLGTVENPLRINHFALSPDEQRLALSKDDVEGRAEDILMIDLSRNITSRFTLDPGSDSQPIWSSSGDQILFRSSRNGEWRPYIKSARGPGEARDLGIAGFVLDWFPDSRSILISITDPEGDLALVAMDDPGKREILVSAQTGVFGARFSPDGKWFAYDSVESGRREIYLQALDGSGDRVQVSTEGGDLPEWRGDGRELYYRAPGGFLMAVEITYEPYLELSSPKSLFVVPEGFNSYDVTGDGERFLVSASIEGRDSKPLTVVLNWTEGLGEK